MDNKTRALLFFVRPDDVCSRATNPLLRRFDLVFGLMSVHPRSIVRNNWFDQIRIVRNSSSEHTSIRRSIRYSVNNFGARFADTLFAPDSSVQIERQEAIDTPTSLAAPLTVDRRLFPICYRTTATVSFVRDVARRPGGRRSSPTEFRPSPKRSNQSEVTRRLDALLLLKANFY